VPPLARSSRAHAGKPRHEHPLLRAVSAAFRNPWSRGCPSGGGSHDQRCTHRSCPEPVPVVGARRGFTCRLLFRLPRSEASANACTSTKANEVISPIRSDRPSRRVRPRLRTTPYALRSKAQPEGHVSGAPWCLHVTGPPRLQRAAADEWMGCYPRLCQMEQHLERAVVSGVTKPPTLGFAMFRLRNVMALRPDVDLGPDALRREVKVTDLDTPCMVRVPAPCTACGAGCRKCSQRNR